MTDIDTRTTVADVADNAGLIEARRRRATGRVVSIYDNAAQGLDDDGGREPWSTVCEDHGGVISHATLGAARTFATAPEQWCPYCEEV